MKQVTLISLYGQKPASLSNLLKNCLKIIQESIFQQIFEPYDIDQFHGTFIGMEKIDGIPDICNANIWNQIGKREVMNFPPLVDTVKKYLPMKIRFGGFGRTFRGFKSFSKFPFERSFQIQWSADKVTLIGWPHRNDNFSSNPLLKNLRVEVEERCNIRHKYAGDNDLYMVIGEITDLGHLSQSERKEIKDATSSIEEKVRGFLENNPIDVEIKPDQVFLARYREESLPLDSTETYCIDNPGIDVDFIKCLYK
jgi:hypothetical protein